MKYTIATEPETDGRWIAEVVELPGVLAYGQSEEEATARAEHLANQVKAGLLELIDQSWPVKEAT